MKNSKVLEMIRQNRIDELIKELQDEIFAESLKGRPNAKKRYLAMKRYLNTISESRPILQKPCEVELGDRKYNSFTNGYSLALTTESCGELEMCSEPERYPDVSRLINFNGDEDEIKLLEVIAEAKSLGYKYTKNSIHRNEYLMHYKDSYFRIPLLDITYGILNDGKNAVVYYSGRNMTLTLETDIGIGLILPVKIDKSNMSKLTIIEVV